MNRQLRIAPGLGGWLSVMNLFVVTFVVVRAEEASAINLEPVGEVLALFALFALSLPILWVCLFIPAINHQPGYADAIFFCLVLVVNGFLWGYGIERLWRQISVRQKPSAES